MSNENENLKIKNKELKHCYLINAGPSHRFLRHRLSRLVFSRLGPARPASRPAKSGPVSGDSSQEHNGEDPRLVSLPAVWKIILLD